MPIERSGFIFLKWKVYDELYNDEEWMAVVSNAESIHRRLSDIYVYLTGRYVFSKRVSNGVDNSAKQKPTTASGNVDDGTQIYIWFFVFCACSIYEYIPFSHGKTVCGCTHSHYHPALKQHTEIYSMQKWVFLSLSLLFASLCDCFLFILCVRVPHVHFMIYNFFNCNCMRCGCSAIEHSAHPPFEAFLNDYFAFCYKTVCVFLSFNTHTQCNVHVHTSSSSCVPFNVYLHSFTILIHLSAFSFVNCNWRFMLVVAMCQSDWCMWKFECVYMLNRWLIIFLSVNIRPRVERFE